MKLQVQHKTCGIPGGTVMATGRKRSFDAAFMLQVVSLAEKSSNRGAAKRFKVDEKRVIERKLQKEKLKQLCAAKKK